jgi:uncharacterized protein (TIGR02594 family)
MKAPNWLAIARKYDGAKEIPGARHHPDIVFFHSFTTLQATDDETPWCSSFVCAVMELAGYQSTRNAKAISWKDWGQALPEPKLGCIVVFPHHVGFFMGWKNGRLQICGGNQSNMVNITLYRPETVVSYRWPDDLTIHTDPGEILKQDSLVDYLSTQDITHLLAVNIFMEARGEPDLGKYAVGHVVFNRAADPRWPVNPKDVILQKGQFSWVWSRSLEDRARRPWDYERNSWLHCLEVAKAVVADRTQGGMGVWDEEKAREIVLAVASGDIQTIAALVDPAKSLLEKTDRRAPDPSAGANHYLNLDWCRRNNPNGSWRAWYDPLAVTLTIGAHTFLNL